ncbi:hypothetical protein JZ751_002593 [Albula glossodonta]|uniref:Uncharacterized protein n=1 Tax=Albula glossodonta TaxID=121402 RepID=A0A8T2N8I7_9TELE|nr:hypothetical protein JZ751_002593 [Albula glossodonta]
MAATLANATLYSSSTVKDCTSKYSSLTQLYSDNTVTLSSGNSASPLFYIHPGVVPIAQTLYHSWVSVLAGERRAEPAVIPRLGYLIAPIPGNN